MSIAKQIQKSNNYVAINVGSVTENGTGCYFCCGVAGSDSVNHSRRPPHKRRSWGRGREVTFGCRKRRTSTAALRKATQISSDFRKLPENRPPWLPRYGYQDSQSFVRFSVATGREFLVKKLFARTSCCFVVRRLVASSPFSPAVPSIPWLFIFSISIHTYAFKNVAFRTVLTASPLRPSFRIRPSDRLQSRTSSGLAKPR